MTAEDLNEEPVAGADWWRWRGKMDALQNVNTQRLGDIATSLHQLGDQLNRRLDAQDVQIGATLKQATLTNGRVTTAEGEIVGIKQQLSHDAGLREGEDRVEIRHEVKRERTNEQRRWAVSTLVGATGVIVAAGGGLGGIAETLHLLGVI